MAKFLYSAAMSLDGFIAGPSGDMSWMTDYLGPNPIVDELITRTGAILAGNGTFSGDDPFKGQPGEGEVFGGGWDGPQFLGAAGAAQRHAHSAGDQPVVSRHRFGLSKPGVALVHE
jgi:RibD C-terminal domain